VTVSLVTVAALMIATGWMAQRTYSRGRYAHGSLAWARDLRGTRIAVAGGIGSYSLFGSDLSNRVEEVARRGRHGALVPIASCREWRRALARGKYRYVVTSPRVIIPVGGHLVYGSFFGSSAPEATWTRSDPAASEVRRGADGVSVFQLDGTVTAGGCGRGPRPTQSR
jgi:hypothetical protein